MSRKEKISHSAWICEILFLPLLPTKPARYMRQFFLFKIIPT